MCEKISSSTKTLLDLNKDILQHTLTRYAGLQELGRLAQTSKSMRDTLYDPLFWRGAFPALGDINGETAASLDRRQIKKIQIAEMGANKSLTSSLKLCADLQSLEMLLLRDLIMNDAKLQFSSSVKFQSLKTLIVTITASFISAERVLITLGKIVPEMKHLKQLCVLQMGRDRCDQLIKTSFEHQCLSSASLQDFEYSYVYGDFNMFLYGNAIRRCCDGKWKPDYTGLPVSQCEKLERIAITSHISLLEVQHFNNLQHLMLCLHPGLFPRQHRNEFLMPSVKSLVVTCICATNNSDFTSLCKLIQIFPNLIALDLSYIDMSKQLQVSGQKMESFVRCCPKLRVLNFGQGCKFSDKDLLSIVHTLIDLEVISLPGNTMSHECRNPEKLLEEIVKCLPKLKSFISPPSNLAVDKIPGLIYTSHNICTLQEDHQPPAKRRQLASTSCKCVPSLHQPYMAEIPEALGYQYFFSESYFNNYDLIYQQRRALSSTWKEYFRWNSKRYNDNYMWDSDYEDWVRAEERDHSWDDDNLISSDDGDNWW